MHHSAWRWCSPQWRYASPISQWLCWPKAAVRPAGSGRCCCCRRGPAGSGPPLPPVLRCGLARGGVPCAATAAQLDVGVGACAGTGLAGCGWGAALRAAARASRSTPVRCWYSLNQRGADVHEVPAMPAGYPGQAPVHLAAVAGVAEDVHCQPALAGLHGRCAEVERGELLNPMLLAAALRCAPAQPNPCRSRSKTIPPFTSRHAAGAAAVACRHWRDLHVHQCTLLCAHSAAW